MRLSLAPMEGLTNPSFRRAHERFFGGADVYYTPFYVPTSEGYARKFLDKLAAERCTKTPTVVQFLTVRATDFLAGATQVAALGYEEINLNFGCPSGTVTAKGKIKAVGAGSCVIYVLTTNGIWKTVTITVDTSPTKVKLNKVSKTMKVGSTQDLGAKVVLTPAKAQTTLRWISSNPAVATIDANGIVTAIKKGKTVITVITANGKKAKVTIKVK